MGVLDEKISQYLGSLGIETHENTPYVKHILFAFVSLYIFVQIANTIYSVYFGPLSRFPGPTIAAATKLWQSYVAFVEKAPLFRRKLWHLHEIYGPVIRIGPNELHFSNPDAYSKVYLPKFDKDRDFYEPFGPLSVFGESTFAESKKRKDRISNFFSKREVSKMQFLVQEKVDRLVARVAEESQTSGTVNVFLGFKSMAVEIMTSFCFANNVGALEARGFSAPLVSALEHATEAFVALIHFGAARRLINKLPLELATKLAPKLKGFFDLQRVRSSHYHCISMLTVQLLREQIHEIFQNPSVLEQVPHNTIFHVLVKDGTEESVFDEGQTLMIGGTETVSNTLTYCTYYLLANKERKERLVQELRQAWPDVNAKPRWEEIEKLPFLTAVLKEGLRMTPNAPQGLKRVAGPRDVMIDGHLVPAGVRILSLPLKIPLLTFDPRQ